MCGSDANCALSVECVCVCVCRADADCALSVECVCVCVALTLTVFSL